MEANAGSILAPVNYSDDNVAKPLENQPVNFYSLTLEDLKAYIKSKGKEQFRAQQIFKWVYEQRVTDPEQMTNLSKEFRQALPSLLSFDLPPVLQHLKSVDGTQKFLFDMKDGMSVEVVFYDGKAISVELPTSVEREITWTEPAVKGDTSGKVLKPAKIATGFEVPVPLFVNQGDKIEIDTRTGEYRKRV
mgnify:CR=1 FL=1